MKIYIFVIPALVLLLGASSTSVSAKTGTWEPFQTLEVDSYSPNYTMPHEYSEPLEEGVLYRVTVIGTANAGDTIEFDAQCSLRSNSATEWTESVSTYASYGEDLLDLHMDGDHDWGVCSSDHTYTKEVIGEGEPLDFFIRDVYPMNNVGSLDVTIERFWENHGQYVSQSEDKQEAAQSRVGMPEQSKGHTKEK